MTDLYLIAHRVRGQPAFDIATRIQIGDEEGWIIPTSGHRAYPYWQIILSDLVVHDQIGNDPIGLDFIPTMPETTPDHYSINDRPSERESFVLRPSLGTLLGLRKAPEDFKRRV